MQLPIAQYIAGENNNDGTETMQSQNSKHESQHSAKVFCGASKKTRCKKITDMYLIIKCAAKHTQI